MLLKILIVCLLNLLNGTILTNSAKLSTPSFVGVVVYDFGRTIKEIIYECLWIFWKKSIYFLGYEIFIDLIISNLFV